ncbi:MAG TPA: sigma-70 family RNA polymerase sigma factor [Tepidisphaeraceae bacterium]|nr:sigma-70 family RNA polymerase sigma factor [Tepidisphaeraceae bacterium]
MVEDSENLYAHRSGAERALERLVDAYTPLVRSVCRRYLRDPEDLEDAVQQTFLKFAQHAVRIDSSLASWLVAVAQSSSIDLIRCHQRQQRHLEAVGRAGTLSKASAEHQLVHEVIRQRLQLALLELDPPSRQLVIERFYEKVPLRVIAAREGVAAGTISRRVAAALQDLAAILRDMGINAVDELTLAEHFGDPANLRASQYRDQEGLRFSTEWRATEPTARRDDGVPLSACLPGWNRPIRVGVLVSYLTLVKPASTGVMISEQAQVRTAGLLIHPAFRFVAIVEPGTDAKGPVEQVLREYDLVDGLIDATDEAALRTLDLIMIGVNAFISSSATRALSAAVRSGVGLLNEFWTGEQNIHDEDPHLAELMLSCTPLRAFHTKPHCGEFLTASVIDEHPLLPGLKQGMTFLSYGCGPVYRPTPGTKVLVVKDQVIEQDEHGIPGLGPARMPVCLVGQLGSGRVFIANVLQQAEIAQHLTVSPTDYLLNVVSWLVAPRC